MSDIHLEYVNSIFLRVRCEPGIMMEMCERFTFMVDGYKFMPAYKNGVWDGKIRLLNRMSGLIYVGLQKRIYNFAEQSGYTIASDQVLIEEEPVPEGYAVELSQQFKTPFEPYDYQQRAVEFCIRKGRGLLISPTASGKSFIIYLTARHYVENESKRVLVIVPTVSLVTQMVGDFKDYNNGVDVGTHAIYSGKEKNSDADYVVTTWQSVYKMKRDWFDQFDVIIGDEAHQFKSKSLINIMEKANVQHKFGFTGTLDDSMTNELTLEGLFGEQTIVTKTIDLIEKEVLSDFKINALLMNYPDEFCKEVSKMDYQEEMDWIVSNYYRNKFICNLGRKLDGNVLILFQYVEKHGKVLEDMLRDQDDKRVHFIHGGIDADHREWVRHEVENSTNNIVLASYGTYSTGVNIKRLDHAIAASPSKSKIRNLQSIGRILRRGNGSTSSTWHDIADNLIWKKKSNHTARHFRKRMEIYNEQGFEVKTYNINLKGHTP